MIFDSALQCSQRFTLLFICKFKKNEKKVVSLAMQGKLFVTQIKKILDRSVISIAWIFSVFYVILMIFYLCKIDNSYRKYLCILPLFLCSLKTCLCMIFKKLHYLKICHHANMPL